MSRVNRFLLWTAFSAYAVILVWIIALKCNWEVPISDCFHYTRPMSIGERVRFAFSGSSDIWKALSGKDGVLNLLAFLPLGIYMPFIHRGGRFIKALPIAAGLTLTFELIQLLSCVGAASVVDLAANILGFVAGYALSFCIFVRLPSRAINCINTVVVGVGVPVAIYAVANTVLHLEIYTLSYYGL